MSIICILGIMCNYQLDEEKSRTGDAITAAAPAVASPVPLSSPHPFCLIDVKVRSQLGVRCTYLLATLSSAAAVDAPPTAASSELQLAWVLPRAPCCEGAARTTARTPGPRHGPHRRLPRPRWRPLYPDRRSHLRHRWTWLQHRGQRQMCPSLATPRPRPLPSIGSPMPRVRSAGGQRLDARGELRWQDLHDVSGIRAANTGAAAQGGSDQKVGRCKMLRRRWRRPCAQRIWCTTTARPRSIVISDGWIL